MAAHGTEQIKNISKPGKCLCLSPEGCGRERVATGGVLGGEVKGLASLSKAALWTKAERPLAAVVQLGGENLMNGLIIYSSFLA